MPTVPSQISSPQCKSVSSGCFRDVSSHHSKDSSFCGVFNWKKSCDLASNLSSACDCLIHTTSMSSSAVAPNQTPSFQCKSVSEGCFRDISSHRDHDSGFCGRFNSRESCDLLLSKYSRGDVSCACNCLTPPSSTPSPSHAPSSIQPSSTHSSTSSTHSSTHSLPYSPNPSSTHPSSSHSSSHSGSTHPSSTHPSWTHSSTHSSSTCHATAMVTHSASAVAKTCTGKSVCPSSTRSANIFNIH